MYKTLNSFCLTVIVLTTLYLSGCSATQDTYTSDSFYENGSAAGVDNIVWPSPPEKPRIRLVGILHEPKDVGISGFRKFINFLFGQQAEFFIRPMDIKARGHMLYIADAGRQAFFIIDRQKKELNKVSSADKRTALKSPVGIALSQNQIYVSDSYLNAVFVYGTEGEYIKTIGQDILQRPTGISFSETDQKLYVSDTIHNRIAVFDKDGNFIRFFGSRGTVDGQFNYPTYIWTDSKGRIYVNDSLNFRVQVFSGDGAFISKFGSAGDGSGDMARSKGIATDTNGNIYIVDSLFDTVQIFDSTGRLLLNFGSRGTKAGEFWLPAGIFIDENNYIYVADSFNKRIQYFELIDYDE